MKQKKEAGMTILELLVVIAILGIFMGIAIPSVTKSFTLMARAKKSAARYPAIRRTLGAVSDTIRQSYATADDGNAVHGRDSSYEAGGIMLPSDELDFSVMDTRYSSIGSVQNMTYALQLTPAQENSERGLVQTRSPLDSQETGIREVLLPKAMGLNFRFLDTSQQPPAWVEQWPPKQSLANIPFTAGSEDTPAVRTESPAAIEITVYVLSEASSQPSPFKAVVNLPTQSGK